MLICIWLFSAAQTQPTPDTQHTKTDTDSNSKVKQKSATSTEQEADFDHLTKAAEQMMATWAAEDDDHPPLEGWCMTQNVTRWFVDVLG